MLRGNNVFHKHLRLFRLGTPVYYRLSEIYGFLSTLKFDRMTTASCVITVFNDREQVDVTLE